MLSFRRCLVFFTILGTVLLCSLYRVGNNNISVHCNLFCDACIALHVTEHFKYAHCCCSYFVMQSYLLLKILMQHFILQVFISSIFLNASDNLNTIFYMSMHLMSSYAYYVK